MKRENELTIDLELTVKSPVHIGTGDTQVGNEYRIDGADAEAIDIPRYLDDNPGKAEDVISVMKDEMSMAGLPDVEESYARYPLRAWVDSESIRGSPVQVAIKDGTNTPYIPGSSLKGWLRTALAYRVLDEKTKGSFLKKAIADVDEDEDITALFRSESGDLKSDLLRCVTIRDAHPVSDPTLALCEIDTRRYKSAERDDESQETGDPSWMGFSPTYAEFLLPTESLDTATQATFTTEIQVDIGLLQRLLGSRAEPDVTVFGDELTKDRIQATIIDALQRFQQGVISEERSILFGWPDSENTVMDNFYEERLKRFISDPSEKDILFRVGANTGQYSKTVMEVLPARTKILTNVDDTLSHKNETDCGGELSIEDDETDTLSCEECGEVVEPTFRQVDQFPKTRRGVQRLEADPSEDTDDSTEWQYYPLGWIEASLRGPL
ncbi:type III-A CRISPR-associated RAMP protein Csm5 [Halocatena salina]|uniref:CRISPR system Cms protein Csm5 n=1 Tax=Halocatena salina TaxID=2934340 RepID=A0A8U0A3C2_9EURY|nr:type III-A CRISPR-associated RAMP protein Csm5 [Halocatena salina]UPM42477.1 type III-A CRISPR-associated RAMP protein Csm5 [Halocatena salina]